MLVARDYAYMRALGNPQFVSLRIAHLLAACRVAPNIEKLVAIKKPPQISLAGDLFDGALNIGKLVAIKKPPQISLASDLFDGALNIGKLVAIKKPPQISLAGDLFDGAPRRRNFELII